LVILSKESIEKLNNWDEMRKTLLVSVDEASVARRNGVP
jgi:hypothetical protein